MLRSGAAAGSRMGHPGERRTLYHALCQFKHPVKQGLVTVAGNLGVDIPIGTLKNILKQAQIQEDRE